MSKRETRAVAADFREFTDMVNEPPTEKRDPRRHKWRLWDEMLRLREEARAARADRVIRTIGGIILVAIVVVVVVAGLSFLIKHLW
jgi:t-SNARE complex subunit (syntaxin)